MIFSDDGKAFLVSVEGICLSPYLDSKGVKTIAIGATVSEIPDIAKMPWDTTITMREAFTLLDRGLKKYMDAVNRSLDVSVTQYQFDALVSFCYNVGTGVVKDRIGGMSGSTLLKRINRGESKESIRQAFMMWLKPPEIKGRRTKEANLFVNGNYGDGKANVFPVNSVTHKPQYSKGKIIKVAEYLG